MKAYQAVLTMLLAIVVAILSYFVYPVMYQAAWKTTRDAIVAFVTNDTTRLWTSVTMLAIAAIMMIVSINTLRTVKPRQAEPRA